MGAGSKIVFLKKERGTRLKIACLDMESVLVPEIWINMAKKNRYRLSQAHNQGHLRL